MLDANTPILELRNVVKDFTTGGGFAKTDIFRALNDVSFSIHKGRALALVGESGCGKSTCARLITKIYEPTAGEILFRGQDITQIKARQDVLNYRKSVQMIFQDPFGSLNPTHTIYHHLARPLLLHRMCENDKTKLRERVCELLEMVELPALTADKYPHELSGGQRQRVNMAKTLAVGADLVLADEPTSMLDVSIRIGVLDLMQRMKKEFNLGFLYITHDLATAHYIAEETAVMYKGQIVEWGDTTEVINNPQHPYTQLLISAVPDPDVRFADVVKGDEDYSGHAQKIREISSAKVDQVKRVNHNHYVRLLAG
ncbi:ATP-binding cassette domain-containing protein [Motilimonas eburnea]|uniref:ATP-binding cassette domain-containing protein n=1 Tax=Motilimonas eburnea TaxID=1737488 RepID=UPI001E2E184A|nr:ATP-binding cassette domain-containing protein [Motilimonas eburnea]MCE2570167.1 ATP-binding cassette domain-containing protein [Motilimonas eburnea]